MTYPDYKDPRVIVRDQLDTYVEAMRHIKDKGVLYSTEDIRAMTISAHIQADRNGYRGPVPVEMHHGTPAENVHHSEGTGPQQEAEPHSDCPQGNSEPPRDYDRMVQVASVKSMEMLKGVLAKAYDIHAKAEQVNIRDAETAVKIAIRDAFEKRWNFSPNLAQPKGRMNQGQVSWTIKFVLDTWEAK